MNKKNLYVHTHTKHYQIIFIHEKKGILLFGTTWMNPEVIRLSEEKKNQKRLNVMRSHLYVES